MATGVGVAARGSGIISADSPERRDRLQMDTVVQSLGQHPVQSSRSYRGHRRQVHLQQATHQDGSVVDLRTRCHAVTVTRRVGEATEQGTAAAHLAVG